jgi:hypothetical protein
MQNKHKIHREKVAIAKGSFTTGKPKGWPQTPKWQRIIHYKSDQFIGQAMSNYRRPCWMVHLMHYTFEPWQPPS